MEFNNEYYFENLKNVLDNLCQDSLQDAIKEIRNAWLDGVKIVTCGNGGSAIIGSHYVNDWVKSSDKSNGNKLRGFCLSDNVGLVTAYANDIRYEEIYSEQCKALLDKNDLLIVISGSGNSQNIIKALEEANNLGAKTLAILGFNGGNAINYAHKSLVVPSHDMQICEDIFMIFGHLVMKQLSNAS